MNSIWSDISDIIRAVTGRNLIGTDGGDYAYTTSCVFVPRGGVESAIHELCHFVVASDDERKQENYGLTSDWASGDAFRHGVTREEETFSLEFFLLGDPSVIEFGALMTCEANATCSPVGLTRARMRSAAPPMHERQLVLLRTPYVGAWVTDGMLARTDVVYQIGLIRGDNLRPDGSERIRAEVLRRADSVRLPIDRLITLARRWRQQ